MTDTAAPAPLGPALQSLADAITKQVLAQLPKPAAPVIVPPPPAQRDPSKPLTATEKVAELHATVDAAAPSCEGLTVAQAQSTGNQALVRAVHAYGQAKQALANAEAVLDAEARAAAEAK